MKNFDFLKDNSDFADLYRLCDDAECYRNVAPEWSALRSRQALEYMVKAVYLLKGIPIAVRASLFELVNADDFRNFINDTQLMRALHYIRNVGNKAAHNHLGDVTAKEAFFCVLNLHTFVSALLVKLEVITPPAPFDAKLGGPEKSTPMSTTSPATLPDEQTLSPFKEKLKPGETLQIGNPDYFSEAETRRIYIDQMLQEAGWRVLEQQNAPLPACAGIEIEVKGMPNQKETGYADYVLYGRDGKPLAVVEAKRTSVSPEKGKHQATLYADALEKQYGRRPVIYYTNGYETRIIDGLGYPPRTVMGFHNLEELELMMQRKGRGAIRATGINDEITNRAYQKMAITAVAEHFNKMHRRALLVMATGTGKTRVAISLSDILTRCDWAKNILFLADRTALVKQAHKNFNKLLPSLSTCILSDSGSNRDLNARILFSTYQTMINWIDADVKDFSIGRFDLIIIDEAHRSVFGKYGAIFDYFDSCLVGLTATPREDIDRSTYTLFDMEQGEPNFAYELDTAIKEGYLVPYQLSLHKSKHISRGIKYDDLSADEQEQLEKVWAYESAEDLLDENSPKRKRDINSNEIFKYIYNTDTIDRVLQDLMQTGLYVQNGERIGKSIIFAYNHAHAELIVKRFHTLYPQFGPDFCVLIDNQVNYAQDLIDKLDVRDMNPQIAVSVDMLDTGIDIPDILNLVFFKVVRSKIKFNQMIGRGTRLSKDIFGSSVDKEYDKKYFLIFDYCGNFEFFKNSPQGIEPKAVQTLTGRLFNIRTDLVFELQQGIYQEDEFASVLYTELKEGLIGQITNLNRSLINVKKQLKWVDYYSVKENWNALANTDTLRLKTDLSPLLLPTSEEETAKQFDLLILGLQYEQLNPAAKAYQQAGKVIRLGALLEKKASLPEVKMRLPLIREIQQPNFWENRSLESLERVRKELRDLMQYLIGEEKRIFTVDIQDEFTALPSEADEEMPVYWTKTYKERVLDYLKEHSDNEAIDKIKRMEQLDGKDIATLERILWEEVGTREEYGQMFSDRECEKNNMPSVAMFIRAQVGVNQKIAMQHFSDFLNVTELNASQQEFLKQIIEYVSENGDITPDTLMRVRPFSEMNIIRLFGPQSAQIVKLVNNIHAVVMG